MIATAISAREEPTVSQRSIQQNHAQQARARQRLDKAGGELKPKRRPQLKATSAPRNPWGIPGISPDVRVEIKAAQTESANFTAQGLARALESCGFTTKLIQDSNSTWEGVHVESRTDQAAAAILIQGAFRTAGVGAGLTIHDRAAAKRIVVHVGPRGLW